MPTNLETLTKSHKEDRNPGHKLGEFLIELSNSNDFLEAHLEAYLKAVRADKAAAGRRAASLFKNKPGHKTPFESAVDEATDSLARRSNFKWRGHDIGLDNGVGPAIIVNGTHTFDTVVAAMEAIRDGEL